MPEESLQVRVLASFRDVKKLEFPVDHHLNLGEISEWDDKVWVWVDNFQGGSHCLNSNVVFLQGMTPKKAWHGH